MDNNYRQILPDMFQLSGRAQVEKLAAKMAEELSPETFRMFQTWLMYAKSDTQIKVNQARNKFW